MKNAVRAFTLLELMMATAISLVVVASATMSVLLIIRTLNRSGQSSAIVTEVQLLSEYLVSQVQGMGGGAVRPWMVTTLENNTGAGGSDVLRFADLPASVPRSAMITSHLGGSAFSLFVPTGVRRGRVIGRCLLRDLRQDTDHDGLPEALDNTAAGYSVEELRGREAVLVSPSGETWRSVVLADAGIEETTGGCFARFDGTSTGLTPNGFFVAADRIARLPDGSEDLQQWIGGQLAFVRGREWRHVPGTPGVPGRLVETIKEQGPAVERVLFENVVDVQIALGYDFGPFDGVLTERPDRRNDEWLNHLGTDDLVVGRIPQGLASREIGSELIRMVDIGVIVALPRAERTVTVRAFDGPARTAPEARVVGGRAYLRNLLLFL